MVWYHDQCVGLDKDEPIGVWLCVSIREVPHCIQHNLIDIKTDVEQLKESSKSIVTILNSLSTVVSRNIQGINDKLTALSMQINCYHTNFSESIGALNTASNTMKTSFDQKTSQILNKTTSMIDKIKSQYETTNPHLPYPSTDATIDKKSNENPNTANATSDADRSDNCFQNRKEPGNSNSRNKYEQTTLCKIQPSATKKQNTDVVQTSVDNKTIDLTEPSIPKKQINQTTLLVGSSILKGIKVGALNKNTAVRSFLGATIAKLQNRLN